MTWEPERIAGLDEENRKLRQLCEELFVALSRESKPYRLTDLSERLSAFGCRMQELGIEVKT